jgi:hypothetical protein
MEVVEGMPVSGKANPVTWEEARSGFEPAELVRGKRSLTVEYRHHGDHWTATSSDLDGFEVSASTLPQLKTAARAVLDDWLDPAVQVNVVEIDEAQPPVTTRSKRRINTSRWASAQTVAAALRSKRQKTGRSVSKKGCLPR